MKGYISKSIKVVSFLFIFLFSINLRNFKNANIVLSTSAELSKTLYKTSSNEMVFSFKNITTRNTMGGSVLYKDKVQSIVANFTVSNSFLDETSYKVYVNDLEDSSYFNIAKAKNGFDFTVTLTPKSGISIPKGSYKIEVKRNSSSQGTATFDVVGYYNNFSISAPCSNSNAYANEENVWTINFGNISNQIKNVIDSRNFTNFSVSVKRKNNNTELVGSKFSVEKNGSITVKNNVDNYPKPGEYVITVTHRNTSEFEPSAFSATTTITVGKRNVNLGTQTSKSHRYIITQKDVNYLSVKKIFEDRTKISYYPLDDSQNKLPLVTETIADFNKKYPDVDLNAITLDTNGNMVYEYEVGSTVSIKITNLNNTNVTYILGENTLTDTIQNFEKKYPGVIDKLKENYDYDSDSSLLRYIKKLKDFNEISSLDQVIFATSGGEFTFDFTNYRGITKADLENAFKTAKIVSNDKVCSASSGSVCDSQNDKFTLSCKITDEIGSNGATIPKFTCQVKYSNTLAKYGNGNREDKNSSSYYINLDFADADSKQIGFSLYDQAIDYYLTSEYDKHDGESDELQNLDLPPANMRYNYYLGLYLVKGGKKQDNLSDDPITTRIFDRHVEYTSDNKLKYYDVATFQIKIKKYLNDKVTFDSWMNDVYQGEKTLSTEEFLNKYEIDDRYPKCGTDNPNYLKCYAYNSDGTINDTSPYKNDLFVDKTNNNKKIDILKFYPKGDNQYIQFVENKTTTRDYTLEKFKATYPEMYYLVITKFVYDENGNIQHGKFMGEIKIYEENGKPIEGHEVTEQFTIAPNGEMSTAENPERAVTVLPKTEVNAGTYYVYTQYGTLPSIGFVNEDKNGEEATISKALFPEMWKQNIHMTSMSYAKPVYNMKVTNANISNIGNEKNVLYNNIDGEVSFDFETDFIYSSVDENGKSRFNAKILEINDNTTTDVTNKKFRISEETYNASDGIQTKANSNVKIKPIVGSCTTGKYKIVITYEKNGVISTAEKEFEVVGKFYDMNISLQGTYEEIIDGNKIQKEDNKLTLTYARNVSKLGRVYITTSYIDNVKNIIPSIKRVYTGGEENLIHDAATSSFKNSEGKIIFTYSYSSSNINSYQKYYIFQLTNKVDNAEIGSYELNFSYQEGTNDILTKKVDFVVTKDEYVVDISNRTTKANDDGLFINYDISTEHIKESDLDNINYTIYYHDATQRKDIDVSSEASSKRMFKIRDNWDLTSGPNYKGKLIIELIQNKVDMNGSYYIVVSFGSTINEYELTDGGKLKDLFEWNFESVDITSIYDEEGTPVKINGFYNNLTNKTIDVKIKSPYEKNISWVINKDCVGGTCDPTVGTNYNSVFTATNTTKDNKKLKLVLKENLDEVQKLASGTYALVLYYTNTDYKVYKFDVMDDYIDIIFDKEHSLIYSRINDTTVSDGLFANKPGKIYVPVKVRGPKYDDENIKIKITDETGNTDYTNYFEYNRLSFNETHNLDIDYKATKTLPVGKYMLTMEYATDSKIVKDVLNFTVNQTYFNFYFKDTTYEPNPLIPNNETGGKIKYLINTEDINNIQTSESGIDSESNKHVFSKNTRIYNSNNEDVTDKFNIYAKNYAKDFTSFELYVEYEKNAVVPGTYRLVTYYQMDGFKREKETTFEIVDYKKEFNVKNVNIITNAVDGNLHNNVDATIEVNLESEFQLFATNMSIKILNSKNEDVTSKFRLEKYNYKTNIYYIKENNLDPGEYRIVYTYQENNGLKVVKETTIKMYSIYKEIKIDNMESNNKPIYADQENMSYTFKVAGSVSNNESNKLKAKIYDEEGNVLYNNVDNNITHSFEVINNFLNDGTFKINIIPFKARVGKYYIEIYYYEDEHSYSVSNKLEFTIDDTLYKVNLNDSSYIKENVNYGDNLIYDIDGAKGYYEFTSTYDNSKLDVYSIRSYKGLTLVNEVKLNVESLNNLLKSDFITGALTDGEIDFYICINGLPYTKITKEISKYIKINELLIPDEITLYNGEERELVIDANPSNYTNKLFEIISDNDSVTINNKLIKGNKVGSANVTVKNKDITKQIKINVLERLTSNVFEINYSDHTIFVSSMTQKNINKNDFLSRLRGVVSNYKILDKNNNNITSMVTNIGTNMSLVNGNETYKIIVIGDLNGDGKINVFDVSMLYNYVRGKTSLDKYTLKAAAIRKQDQIKVADVSKLYSFVRDRISGI